jgi:ferredoxin
MEHSIPQRLTDSVPGRYYTTDECDGCAYCAAVAPENFEYDKNTNRYYVARQPLSAEEEESVREAAEDCPVDAIQARVSHAVAGDPVNG